MDGWKTILTNAFTLIGTLLALKGISFGPDQQSQLVTGIATIVAISGPILSSVFRLMATKIHSSAGVAVTAPASADVSVKVGT